MILKQSESQMDSSEAKNHVSTQVYTIIPFSEWFGKNTKTRRCLFGMKSVVFPK